MASHFTLLLEGDVLSNRKLSLLRHIIEQYVETAKPVGSKLLAEHPDFPELHVSPATIRNDMKELEDLGLITQPHTSAGRIPTEAGYKYYVQHYISNDVDASQVGEHTVALREAREQVAEPELQVKQVAKALAELSNNAVLARIGPFSYYYTGISNMFRQPEFATTEVIVSLSELIDQLDEALDRLRPTEDVQILIGKDNPVSEFCSAVTTGYLFSDSTGLQVPSVLAILGPMRMQYQHNYNLLQSARVVLA